MEPTPTLTLNEVFELPDKEAAKEIERQRLTKSTPTPYSTQIPKLMSEAVFSGKWGTYSTGDGQFHSPVGVAVAPDGSAYVVYVNNRRIQKFAPGP